jgi:hypothetical protein
MENFMARRRQKYLDEESYKNTIRYLDEGKSFYDEILNDPNASRHDHASALFGYALDLWRKFQIEYTAGVELTRLAESLSKIVDAYDRYVQVKEEMPDEEYYPPFILNDLIDTYVDLLNLLSAAVLLHREDLLPTIFGWIKGGEYDGADAVLEELLNFYFTDRPSPDDWLWTKPYEALLTVIDAAVAADRAKLMKKYVKGWYPAMKGRAGFWGKHEKIKPELSPYFGYWAMCAGAFTYLLDIDDSLYREEEVYPRDMVDYARSQPRRAIKLSDGSEILRVEGGQRCPSEGTWFSPAKSDSSHYFKVGEIMPVFDASEYGHTIWQRVS